MMVILFSLFQNGWNIIMDVALHGHADVIKLLLEAGAIAIKTKEVIFAMLFNVNS